MRMALLTTLAASLAYGQSANAPGVLQRYLQASQEHPVTVATGVVTADANDEDAVTIEIEASVPRLQKHGTMRGVRAITRAGQVVYSRLRFSGDRFIKKDVISRYLAADVQNRAEGPDIAITSRNYRFQPRGQADYNGRVAEVFRVTPKHKRPGLFRGELWLDAASAQPLREWGDFVKSPSWFVSRPRFVRDYTLIERTSRPRRLILTAHTSLVGDVEMTIWFDDGAIGDRVEDGSSPEGAEVDMVAASNP